MRYNVSPRCTVYSLARGEVIGVAARGGATGCGAGAGCCTGAEYTLGGGLAGAVCAGDSTGATGSCGACAAVGALATCGGGDAMTGSSSTVYSRNCLPVLVSISSRKSR